MNKRDSPAIEDGVRGFRGILQKLRKRHIIETLAAFIGGGWLIIEFVDRILVAHWELNKKWIDVTFFTLLGTLIGTLVWRWFSGREMPRKFKLELVLIPLVAVITVLLDINLILPMKGSKSETPPASKWKNSIAVLPFENISSEGGQDYFCNGLTDELISRLSNIRGLKVIAKASAFALKEKDVREIGQKLNVATILTGGVRKEGNRIRITPQLTRTDDASLIWSDNYERDVTDFLAVQTEIALRVIDKMKVALLGQEEARITKNATSDEHAYELYMKGKYHRYAELPRDMLLARDYFEQAIQIDPNFAMALAGLAENYMIMGLYTVLPRDEAASKALDAAERALTLDPELSQAHVSMGVIKMVFDWDWPSAENEFRKAIDLNSNNFDAYREYALLLFRNHRYDESERAFLYASKIDPLNAVLFRDLRTLYICMGRADREEEVRKTLMTMRPDWAQPWFDFQAGSVDSAMAAIRDEGRSPHNIEALANTYLRIGNRDEAQKLVKELESLFEKGHEGGVAVLLVGLYEKLGDKNAALTWLEQALEHKAPGLCDISRCVYYRSLQGEPRYQAVLSKVGFK
jgi:adenylate cyclase